MKSVGITGLAFLTILYSCNTAHHLSQSAKKEILMQPDIASAHVGISIFEPATNKYWYNYQGDKYFVPASNAKIPTCYAAMKYLGDSLVGLRYEIQNNEVNILGAGDPTFLHPDFKNQPVFDFLKKWDHVNYPVQGVISDFTPLGAGWAWDDYLGDYEAERSEMPVYGNVAKFYMQGDTVAVSPPAFYNKSIRYNNATLRHGVGLWFTIVRPFEDNSFHALYSNEMYHSKTKFTSQLVPFKTISDPTFPYLHPTFLKLLEDTLHKKLGAYSFVDAPFKFRNVIHSQPTDSFLKITMHRSDNFFAEQALLMVSDTLLNMMSDKKIIDTLLKTDFKDLPQKPHWVDGSGLSRYNLFTPQDFVFLFNKMKNDFGMERIKTIFPTGNTGTLSNYYKKDSGYIFGKTGTLSGVVAFSGFLYTKKNKLLIFSVLVNNHQSSAAIIRRDIEQFLEGVRKKF